MKYDRSRELTRRWKEIEEEVVDEETKEEEGDEEEDW